MSVGCGHLLVSKNKDQSISLVFKFEFE
jgi:hypothetical protein